MANRYTLNDSYSPRTGICVFISHQKGDKAAAIKIAQYIQNSGIDIYFDEKDSSIDRDNPKSVVAAVKTAIRHSTHMLCILSNNALKASMMPWEIGYGYDKLQVVGLTLKELSKSDLPEYLQVVPVLRGTKTLNTFIADTIGRVADSLIREQKMFSTSQMNHPLDNILDWHC